MRPAPIPSGRLIALLLPLLVALAVRAEAQPTPTPTPNPVWVCATKITQTKGLGDYTNNALQDAFRCALDKVHDGVDPLPSSCPAPLVDDDNALLAEVDDCEAAALDALCPLGADIYNPELINALVGNAATSVKSQLLKLVDDIFFAENDGCERPTLPVSANAYQCAEQIEEAVFGQETVQRVGEAYFSCERPRLQTSGKEACVDDITGEPIKQDVIDNEADALVEGLEKLDEQCTAAAIEQLGCPLGAESLTGLKNELTERITTFVRELNLGIFHSPCQGSLPGTPTEPVPANVTLEPSLTKKQVTCGQTLDAAFFGSDKILTFDSDLDCGPAKTATDGIIIAKTGVIVGGRQKTWSIRGPSRSSLRTGVGIKIAPGFTRITIKNFKAIENFGIGIQDADDGKTKKLVIIKTTVRRNVTAGMRIRSPRAKIEEVTADKNGIGLDLSGDGIKVRSTTAKGSLYLPKVGIQLSGVDTNLDGKIVRVTGLLNTIELNQGVGIHVVAGSHTISLAQVRDNVGAGILIDPLVTGNFLETNTLKFNGHGIVVEGSNNVLDTNTAESNLGDGYVIRGDGNSLLNNDSGKKTDRGNGGNGYTIEGTNVSLQDNEAEANLGSGFVLTPTSSTTFFKGNNAQYNWQHGFDIQSPNNQFEACAAEKNSHYPPNDVPPGAPFHEWTLVANNIDNTGNKAGGSTVILPAAGGTCDNAAHCP